MILYQLCMTWLNWPLKFHFGLRTIPHLILTHNTQDFDSINAYLICVIVHVQMWCVCLSIYWSNPKGFFSDLYVFKVILYFCDFSFCSKWIFVFFFKNWFRGLFAKRLRLSFSWNVLKGNFKVTFSYRKSHYCLANISRLNSSHKMFLGKTGNFSNSYRGYRDCFATKSFSRKLQYVSRLISQFSNPRKTCVFSFIRQMW